MYKRFFKPCMDFILAFILALILLLPLLILAFFCKLCFKKAFFIQKRIGKNARSFSIFKLRTLHDDGSSSPYGKALRALSLDEIPQLLNILLGQMSFIGPRPLLPEYLPLYTKLQARRHEVRPGLSGLAQIKGRNALSWEEKFRLDLAYVRKISFCLDTYLMLKTMLIIFNKNQIKSAAKEAKRFKGKK